MDGIFEVGKKGRVVVGLIEIGVIGCAGYGFDKYRMKLFDFFHSCNIHAEPCLP